MFEVPKTKATKAQTEFKFKLNGKTYAIRKLKNLTIGQQEAVHGSSAASPEYLNAIFGEVGTELGDAVRALDDDQFTPLYEAWIDDSEVTPGESQGSSE